MMHHLAKTLSVMEKHILKWLATNYIPFMSIKIIHQKYKGINQVTCILRDKYRHMHQHWKRIK